MKKVLVLISIFIISSTAFAQNKSDSTKTIGIIKINPFQIAFGELRLSYEKPLRKKTSIESSISIVGWIYNVQVYKTNEWEKLDNVYGLVLSSGIKQYFLETQKGFYLNPLFQYKSFYYRVDEINAEYFNIFGFQALFGYKFLFGKKLTLDLYGGAGIKEVIDFANYSFLNKVFYNTILTPQFGVNIGYKINKK